MNICSELDRLKELATFKPDDDHERAMSGLMDTVADMFAAGRVSLMLVDSVGSLGQMLRLVALHGELPETAWNERSEESQSIAAQVLASRQSLVVNDINTSALKLVRRHSGEPASFMACPVPVSGIYAGVLNISKRENGQPFTEQDLAIAEFAAILVGRAIELGRLQGMLNSSFAKMALVLEEVSNSRSFIDLSIQEPQRMAKILAKSFYKEMSRCGLSPNQIIHAASEIISEMTNSIVRHQRRQKRLEK